MRGSLAATVRPTGSGGSIDAADLVEQPGSASTDDRTVNSKVARIPRSPSSARERSALGHLTQHVLQDAAVQVVLHLLRAIEADLGLERLFAGRHVDDHAGLDALGEAFDLERLFAGEAQ